MRLYLLCCWYNRATLCGFIALAVGLLLFAIGGDTAWNIATSVISVASVLLGSTRFGLDSYRIACRTLRIYRAEKRIFFTTSLYCSRVGVRIALREISRCP